MMHVEWKIVRTLQESSNEKMATRAVPLDPSRWSFEIPKVHPKDIPDPPGFSFRSERMESATSSRTESSNKGILEKV
jgi:hypothetical protein